MSEDNKDVLGAILKLELSVMQKLQEQGTAFRDRLDDMQRQAQLELKESMIKVWERFEKIQTDLYAKTDGQRAKDSHATTWLVLGILVNVGFAAFNLLFRKVVG